MPEKRILDFLVDLAGDPSRVASEKAWEGALAESGLTGLQQEVLRSKDFTRIYRALQAEGGVDYRAFLIAIIGC